MGKHEMTGKGVHAGRPPFWEWKLNSLKKKLKEDGLTDRWIYEVNRVSRKAMELWNYKDPREVDENDVRLLLSKIGGGARNQRYYQAILSVYLSYCGNHVVKGMTFRHPHDMRPNARWLTDEQVEQLLSTSMDPREKFIVRMGLSMGMRNVEMRRLKVGDIKEYPDGYYFDVCGKRMKLRSIPASKRTMEAYWDFLEWRDEILGKRKSEMMMIGKRSLGLSYKGMRRIQKIINRRSGVEWTFHDLRRTWGRTAYKAGQPLLKIMFILGHSTEKQTIDYLGLRLDDGKDAIDATEEFYERNKRR